MFAEFEEDDDYDEVDEDQQTQEAPAVPVVTTVDPSSMMTTAGAQGAQAVPVGGGGGGGMDDDDYDEDDYDDPLGGGADAPAQTVVVPTVAATAAVGLGMAQPAPVVPTVAAAAAVPPGVPMVQTISALEAAAPPKPAVPKRPRTKEERGAILKFTDIAHEQSKMQKKLREAYDKDKDKDKNKDKNKDKDGEWVPSVGDDIPRPRAPPMVVDDPLEEDDEEEDESSDEDGDEEDGDRAVHPPPRGWDQLGRAPAGKYRDEYEEYEDEDDEDDDDEAADEMDAYDQRADPAIATRAGDGHFKGMPAHTPAEHVDWEDDIHWGEDSEEEREPDEVEEVPAALPEEPAQLPEVKVEPEIKPEPADSEAVPDEAAPPPQQPKKLLFRLGGAKPPAACKPGESTGDKPSAEGGGDGEGGGGGGGGDEGGIRAITTDGGGGGGGGGGGSDRPAPAEDKGAVKATAGMRGWWGEDPDAPLDVKHVPFTRHAQYTRLWNDEEPMLAAERERLAKLALEKEKEKEDEDEDEDGMDVDDDATGDESPDSSADVVTHVGAGVFGPGIETKVEYRASQPGAAKELLSRRNQALARGEWLDGVHWSPAELLAARETNGPPRVTINPNDRMMRLRSYFPGGDEEMKATEWAACEAFVKPGRHLQPVEDVDAQLNIGLDSDEEGTGAKKKEFDAKKDKGLVGRPGRLDNIFNAAVVSGPPAFRPHSYVKSWPKPEPIFAPPPFQKKAKVGLALGFKTGADDKFQVLVKSFTTESPSVKISVRPTDSVDGLLRKLRKKWTDLRGVIHAHFPEGEQGKAYQAACEEAEKNGEPRPRAVPLDPTATMEQCGIKRRVPEPLIYVEAPEIYLLDEDTVRQEKPPAVAAAQAALARAMGEETEADAAYNAKHQSAEEAAAAAAAIAAGDPAEAVAMAMTKPSDLSATNGKLILVQYAESNPPLIAKPGMGAKRVTYYRRRTQGDTAGRSLTQGGQRHVIDLRPEAASPFISDLSPGQPQESLETTMYRAPMFRRVIGKDEAIYLLIRSPHGAMTMREVTEYFMCGQQEPHIEVFQPNTDRLRDFEERAVNSAVIHTLLKQRDEKVPEEDMRVKVSDIEKQFNRAIVGNDIKRRIRRRVVQPVRPPGTRRRADEWDDDADEFELNPGYRFEDDLMIHRMCPVEEVCAYDSMRAAKAKLEAGRDRDGIARIRKLIGTSMTQMQNAFQSVMRGTTPAQRKGLLDLELMLQLQPWNQTVEFLAAVGGRAVLHLNPSRRLREKTGKFYHYVRRQPPKEDQVSTQPKVKPGTVTGTDADLRKLTMPQSERILKGFGVPESTIKSLHRWKRIGLIRELSGAATADKNAEHSGLSRFARSLRVGIQQQMTEQKEAANKIFKNMRKMLSDKKGSRRARGGAGGSSDDDGGSDDDDDDDESSEEEESDSEDSLADELEQGMDKDTDGPDEDEERRELEEMRRLMGGEGGGAPGEARPLGPTQVPPGKKLVLKRIVTRTYPDGRVEKIEDDVSEAVGDAWMKARKFKPDGEVDLEKSREAVMKILYPHGVDPPQFVSGDQAGHGGGGGGGAGGAAAGIGAGFRGPEDEKAELIRQRKRKMEMLRRRKKRFAQLQAQAGVSAQDLEKLKEMKEAEAAPKPGAGPLKLKFALKAAPPPKPKGKVKGRRGDDEDDYTDYGGPRKTTTRFRGSRRDEILQEIIESLQRDRNCDAFNVPVTKKIVPDYREFVDRPMDLSTIMKNLRRAGGYDTAESWMQDVRQILTNAKLYHESEEEVLMRYPAIITAAQYLVDECEKAVERRAADLKLADQFFDAEKVLGRPLSAEAQEAVDNVAKMVFPGGVTASGAPVALPPEEEPREDDQPAPKEEPREDDQPAPEPDGGFGGNPELE